jgi:hypothetical protein
MASLTELKAAQRRFADLREQIKVEAQNLLAPSLKQFLKDYPQIKTIMWQQYTPYFNDGDTCHFSVYDILFSSAVYSSYQGEEEDGGNIFHPWIYDNQEDFCGVDPKTYQACAELSDILDGMENELFNAFGDHCSVIITEDGITVEEFEHE